MTRSRRQLPLGMALILVVLAGCSATVAGQPQIADPVVGQATSTPAASVTGSALPPGTSTSRSSSTPSSQPPVRPVPPSTVTPTSSSPTTPSSPPPTGSSATTRSTPPTVPSGDVVGSPGAGDPYYPTSGNGGYQVESYHVVLSYDPPTNRLTASNTIAAAVTATGPLARFNLDLQPQLTVSSVAIDGHRAAFMQQDAELVITPATPLAPASAVTIVVDYSGKPGMVAGGTANLGDGGWYRTKDGGALAAGEPYSASSWYPVNEHPSDTAAFSVTATVPTGWDVIANGVKFDGALPKPPAGMHSVRYDEKRPIASYLTTILIDKLTFTTGTYDGTPIVNAFTAAGAKDKALAEDTASVLTVLSKHFGPFPFSTYGGIYTGENLSFALETATRPVYASWVDLDTVVHETAHQWYGDDVTIQRWSDICLNECFASYAPWLYHQDVEGADLDAHWRQQMAAVVDDPGFWSTPLVDMGAGKEFTSVYDRGPLAIHALRHEMGEKAFAELLKGWITTYGGKNAGFDDLEAYASKLAGKDLTAFMDAWFRGTVIPPAPYRTPPGLG